MSMQNPVVNDETPVDADPPAVAPVAPVAPEPAPEPEPPAALIDRITAEAGDFAATVRRTETAKTEHGQTMTALAQAQTAVDNAQTDVTGAQTSGVAAADRLIAVVNEWRTAAVS